MISSVCRGLKIHTHSLHGPINVGVVAVWAENSESNYQTIPGRPDLTTAEQLMPHRQNNGRMESVGKYGPRHGEYMESVI